MKLKLKEEENGGCLDQQKPHLHLLLSHNDIKDQ